MAEPKKHSMVDTTFPVFVPDFPELKFSAGDFEAYLTTHFESTASCPKNGVAEGIPLRSKPHAGKQNPAMVQAFSSDRGTMQMNVKDMPGSNFMAGLVSSRATVRSFDAHDGTMRTENGDVAFGTTGSVLVDLFHELEEVVSGTRLQQILDQAWSKDPGSTLKLIWNARSIHLGKSSRYAFYRAMGWLYQNHPQTLLLNLPWLVRPVIARKAPKRDEQDAKDREGVSENHDGCDSDFEIIEQANELNDLPARKKLKLDSDAAPDEYDIKNGVAHGYWKDLLNLLTLAVHDELKVDGEPQTVLNIKTPKLRDNRKDRMQNKEQTLDEERHQCLEGKLLHDVNYKLLHLSVARLFAEQLKVDLARLESGNQRDQKLISLAAKWAPTPKGSHDRHTCIVSTISELLHPFDSVCPGIGSGDRTLYLKYAREAYQLKTLSKLRKFLQIVERPITAECFWNIDYQTVPSLAMQRYTALFARKDFVRFNEYMDQVAQGKATISGATLLPSTLVVEALRLRHSNGARKTNNVNDVDRARQHELKGMSLSGQWASLVQRIRDSGMLQSSISVADVSGSMSAPRFRDGTTPMDSAIGLALLVAEVTQPPFGGAFITFDTNPQVLRVGGAEDKRTFVEKVNYIRSAPWGGSTDFVAVFEKLILPMAVEHKLKQEDMVKQVFVFSDMQFNSAESSANDAWSTSYQRIQRRFKDAGYEMPKLIFWNLAGGRAGYSEAMSFGGTHAKSAVAPKPVTAAEEGTALLSGYSQGQLKMFLEKGHFEETEKEKIEDQDEGDDVLVTKKSRNTMDLESTMRKAISHEAYRMLKVAD